MQQCRNYAKMLFTKCTNLFAEFTMPRGEPTGGLSVPGWAAQSRVRPKRATRTRSATHGWPEKSDCVKPNWEQIIANE